VAISKEELEGLIGAAEQFQLAFDRAVDKAEDFTKVFGFSQDAVEKVADKIKVAVVSLADGSIEAEEFLKVFQELNQLAVKFASTQAQATGDFKLGEEVASSIADAFKLFGEEGKKAGGNVAGAFDKVKFISQDISKFIGKRGLLVAGVGLFAVALKKVVDLSLAIDDQITSLAKNLNLSNEEAGELVRNLNFAAVASGNVNISGAKLLGNLLKINEQLGFQANLTNDQLIQFTKLTAQTGLTAEEAQTFLDISILTGQSVSDITADAAVTARNLQEQKGIQVSQRQLLQEISQVSSTILLFNKGNVNALSEAVENARALGLNLKDVEKISSSLLDIESSIANEFQAELFLGRDLNLERARAAALQGELAVVGEEIAKQNITSAELTRIGVIGTQEVAKSLGLTVDELTEAVKLQEIQGKSRAELVALGRQDLVDLQERTSAQAKLNAINEQFASLLNSLTTVLLPVAEIIGDLAEGLGNLIAPLANDTTSRTARSFRGGFQASDGQDVVSEIRNTNKLLAANANKNTIIRMNGTAVGEAASVDTRIS